MIFVGTRRSYDCRVLTYPPLSSSSPDQKLVAEQRGPMSCSLDPWTVALPAFHLDNLFTSGCTAAINPPLALEEQSAPSDFVLLFNGRSRQEVFRLPDHRRQAACDPVRALAVC